MEIGSKQTSFGKRSSSRQLASNSILLHPPLSILTIDLASLTYLVHTIYLSAQPTTNPHSLISKTQTSVAPVPSCSPTPSTFPFLARWLLPTQPREKPTNESGTVRNSRGSEIGEKRLVSLSRRKKKRESIPSHRPRCLRLSRFRELRRLWR